MNSAKKKGCTECCKKEKESKKHSKELTEFQYSEYEAQGLRFGV